VTYRCHWDDCPHGADCVHARPVLPPPGSPYWKLTSHLGPLLPHSNGGDQAVEDRFAAELLAQWDPAALAAGLAEMTVMLHRMGQQTFEVEQTLAKALGYPEYDEQFFPDGVPDGSVCTGDGTPVTVAQEAAAKIAELTAEIEQTEEWAEDHGRTITKLEGQLQTARQRIEDKQHQVYLLAFELRTACDWIQAGAEPMVAVAAMRRGLRDVGDPDGGVLHEWRCPNCDQVTRARMSDQVDDRQVSRLLFESREIAEIFADVAEHRTGKPEVYTRDLIERIDSYRAGRGWPPDGFGSEAASGGDAAHTDQDSAQPTNHQGDT
jgi:hypothetical protein